MFYYAPMPVKAEGVNIGGLTFDIDGFEASLVGYYQPIVSMVVPESISYLGREFPVTSIGPRAFYGSSTVVSVDLGSVESVGFKAFANCSKLKTLTVSETVKIVGSYAFYGCGITSLDIPGDDVVLEASAFSACKKMQNITFSGRGAVIGTNAFYKNNGVTNVDLSTVKSVGFKAFPYCNGMTSLTIPGSIGSVSAYAFFKCENLRDLVIGEGIKVIGKSAFSGCTSLESAEFPNSLKAVRDNAFHGVSFLDADGRNVSKDPASLRGNVFFGTGKVLRQAADVSDGEVFTDGGITYAVSSAMDRTVSISGSDGDAVFVPSTVRYQGRVFSVESVDDKALMGSGIVSADLSNVKVIGMKSFARCASLESVTFGDSLESVGPYAFYGISFYDGDVKIDAVADNLRGNVFEGAAGKLVLRHYVVAVEPSHLERGTVTGGGYIKEGDYVTIKAEASYGYSFSHWTRDGTKVSSNPVYTFAVNADATYVADFEPRLFSIDIFSNDSGWGSCSDGGTYLYKSYVTLTASADTGYEFLGWYSGSSYLGNSSTYKLCVEEDAIYVARFGIVHDAAFSFDASASLAPVTLSIHPKYTVEYSSRSVTFSDAMTGSTLYTYEGSSNSPISVDISSGTAVKVVQTILYTDGVSATYTDTYVVDERITHRYSWKYSTSTWSPFNDPSSRNNASGAFNWDLSFKWYYNYYSDSIPRDINGAKSRVDDFVTSDDAWIQTLARYLAEHSSSMSDVGRVNYVLKFVQSFGYEYDEDGKGVSDYWKYPAEMLWEQKGDCEDHAILFAALMEAMGYDSILYYVYCYDTSGNYTAAHLAAGVAVSGASGTSTTFQGVTYYYCETTASSGSEDRNWANVGYIPEGYVIQKTYQVS